MTTTNRPDRTLHMIGNAHIDPVWLWQWPEGYQEVRATFQSAIDRMEEYPDFVFTCDSVLYLEWVEETDKALFESIRKRIADGRWQMVGGWWIEPDCNIPGGESFVRQGLYAQRYLADRFGVTATVGCNVDPFGHAASLPQILRKSGMDSYMFLRPGPHEMALPGQYFWWESPDGSRVLAYRIPNEYCSPGQDIGYHIDKSLALLPRDAADLMVFYGVGNHGGGPTRANLDSIQRLDSVNGLPHLALSSPRRFFDALTDSGAQIPVHGGELQHHAVGCYSAHSGVKQWNRRAENLLQRAEKWAVVADVVAGLPYPREELTEAWKLVLFNQFHDTLGGTAIAPAYEDSRDQFGHASSIAALVFNRAVQSISRRIDIPAEPGMTPVVVVNPHPWRLQTDAEFEFAGFAGEARMVDDDGVDVPVQRTRSHATMAGGRRRLVFPADVPPLGYRVYRIYPGRPPHRPRRRVRRAGPPAAGATGERPPSGRGRPADRVAVPAAGQGDRRRSAPGRTGTACGGHRRPVRHLVAPGQGVRRRDRVIPLHIGAADRGRTGPLGAARREQLRRVDPDRGDLPRRRVEAHRRAGHRRLARTAAPAQAPVPDCDRRRVGDVRSALRPRGAADRRRGGADPGVGRRQRPAARRVARRAVGAQRRQVRAQRARRRDRHDRAAQPGLCVARAGHPRPGRDLRLPRPGPAGLPLPAGAARWRLA